MPEAWFVEWDDSWTGDRAWYRPDEVAEQAAGSFTCYSVGYVSHEDEQSLTLAGSFSLDADGEVNEWGNILMIPQRAITNRFRVPMV